MALKIRLLRGGAKKRPFYRIVVSDVRSPRDSRWIERLGTYNPMLPSEREDRVAINEERVRHWLGVGAKPTDRVRRLLGRMGVMAPAPVPDNPRKAEPGRKAKERAAERAEKEKAKAEAAAAAKAEPEAAAKAEPEAAEPAAAETQQG